MSDIDKILEDVERLHAHASTGWFTWLTESAGWTAQRPTGFVFVVSDRGSEADCKLAVAYRTAAPLLASEVCRLRAENNRLRTNWSKVNDEICQTLGKALGYPWFKDDQENFPGATEANGVCVGDHVAESLADEAAKRIHAIGLAVAEYFAADEIVTREIDNTEPDEPDHGELVEAMYRLTVATTTLKNLTMIGGIK